SRVLDEFLSHVVTAILEGLRGTDSIRAESGAWRRPDHIVRAGTDWRTVIPNVQLRRLLGLEYIHTAVQAPSEVLDALKVPHFGIDDVLRCLEDEAWVSSHDAAWFRALFVRLAVAKPDDRRLNRLKELKIVRLANGKTVSINDGPVFFPLDKSRRYGFEHEL